MSLIVLFASVAIVGAVPVLWWSLASSRQPAAEAVARNLAGGQRLLDLRRARLQVSASERTLEPAIQAMATRARRLSPSGVVESVEHKLVLAGMSHVGIERVLAAKLGLGLLGGMLGLIIWLDGPSATMLLLAAVATAVGYFAPDGILAGKAQRRQEQIQRELADTIDQITISVEAGLGFEASMARVGNTGTGPLTEELSRTLQDIRLGVPRRDAMEKLLYRTNVEDLRRFVHAMRQAEGYGIPIAQVLRVQSAELRDKRKQRAEEKAMKIPVKIVFPVVLNIFPTLFIVILGPAIIRLVRDWPT